MALALEDRAMKDDIMLGDTPKARSRRRRLRDIQTRGRLWKHSTLSDIDGLISPDQIAGLFTFTLVRNPWDRMISYYYWLRAQGFDHPAVDLARQVDFRDFAQSDLIRQSMKASPARSYMTDVTGTERCNLYIRLEHFEEDSRPLAAHLGFSVTLPHANASLRAKGYTEHYDDATRDAVADACAEDIDMFGYRFGQP